ncbi:hypothetical protein ACXZ1K_03810 [Pedobacter sp. PWIIR3]
MSKKLEEYIKGNKKEFDTLTPPDELWEKIAAQLDRQKKNKPFKLRFGLSIAASLVLVLGVAILYTNRNRTAKVEIADVNPGYAKKEIRFASMIEEKRDSLELYAKKNPILYEKFSGDIAKLGADYEHLKSELQSSPNPRFIVKAMVRNLELQLEVINQQLLIINEVDQYKKENKI